MHNKHKQVVFRKSVVIDLSTFISVFVRFLLTVSLLIFLVLISRGKLSVFQHQSTIRISSCIISNDIIHNISTGWK